MARRRQRRHHRERVIRNRTEMYLRVTGYEPHKPHRRLDKSGWWQFSPNGPTGANSKRVNKRKGYVVKGITHRHWWDWFDQDRNSSRAQLKEDTRREIEREMAA